MARTLYIIRHAKASHDPFFPGDFYRTLDPKGYKEAMTMATMLSSKEKTPQLFISSPAIRAYSTALIFSGKLNYPSDEIILKEPVYDASLNALYHVLQEINDNYQTVAIFGHNPGFTVLLNSLCGTAIDNLPTSGIASIDLKNKSWSELKSGSGELLYIKTP